jgi:hypothetical protein
LLLFRIIGDSVAHLCVSRSLIHTLLLLLLKALIQLFNDRPALRPVSNTCGSCSSSAEAKASTVRKMHLEGLGLLLASDEHSSDCLPVFLTVVGARIDWIFFGILFSQI